MSLKDRQPISLSLKDMLSRRKFLQLSILFPVAAAAAACAPPSPALPKAVVVDSGSASSVSDTDTTTVPSTAPTIQPGSGGLVKNPNALGENSDLLLPTKYSAGGPSSTAEDRYFGHPENIPNVNLKGLEIIAPLRRWKISQPFGAAINYQPGGSHTGADAGGNIGDPLLAVHNATVEYVGFLYYNQPNLGRGPYAVILKWDNEGHSIRAIYSHNSSARYADGRPIKIGDQVRTGQEIAQLGSEGYSSGPHLHFEIYIDGQWTGDWQRPLTGGYFDDPEKYIKYRLTEILQKFGTVFNNFKGNM